MVTHMTEIKETFQRVNVQLWRTQVCERIMWWKFIIQTDTISSIIFSSSVEIICNYKFTKVVIMKAFKGHLVFVKNINLKVNKAKLLCGRINFSIVTILYSLSKLESFMFWGLYKFIFISNTTLKTFYLNLCKKDFILLSKLEPLIIIIIIISTICIIFL